MLCDNPIFIVGSPRSGTTLLRSMLDAHPNLFAPNWETGLFISLETILRGDIRRVFEKGKDFPLRREDLQDWARSCADDLMNRFAQQCGKRRWVEKTPAHVFHIDFIAELFPRAQFIHILRNGWDVVKSLKHMSWAPPGRLRRIRWSIRSWVESVRAGKAAGAALPASQYLELRYEDLLQTPTATLEHLCAFLGEPFAPEMQEFHKPERSSWKQAAAPLQSRSLGKYEALSWWESWLFRRMANPLMAELGYRANTSS